eukprot:1160662-Pelagomonas_calceolata.AAC.9
MKPGAREPRGARGPPDPHKLPSYLLVHPSSVRETHGSLSQCVSRSPGCTSAVVKLQQMSSAKHIWQELQRSSGALTSGSMCELDLRSVSLIQVICSLTAESIDAGASTEP